MRKPYFKKSHKAWYVDIDSKPYRLGKDKEAAFQEYHRLMSGQMPATPQLTVCQLFDQFLNWTQRNRAPRTYDWYVAHLSSFAAYVGPKLRIGDVKPHHVDSWLLRCYPNSGESHRNGACRALARAFNWAVKRRTLATSPIAGMERPAYEPSEDFLSPAQWEELIALVKPEDPFHDYVTFLWETGARPQEARILTAAHFDRAGRRLVLERANSKGKRDRRVIRLNDAALAIVERLALKYPDGPIFRNRRGEPWKGFALNNRFSRLSKQLGYKVYPYMLRHGFCTRALKRGVDPLTVATLMGHANAAMVMKVYSHLAQDDAYLEEKLRQATG